MMNLVIDNVKTNQPTVETMTSSQLAEILGFKSKSAVNKKIRIFFDGDRMESLRKTAAYDNRGYVTEYHLPELESKMFVAKHDINYLEIITQFWIDKGQQKEQFQIPQTFGEALQLAANQAQQIEMQALEIKEVKTKVISLENLFHDGGTIPQFVKQFNGVNSQKVNQWLLDDTNWIYRSTKGYRCTAYARDKYLTESERTIAARGKHGFVVYEVQLLADGKKWLYDKYITGELPMKKTWNGEFTHKKDLN